LARQPRIVLAAALGILEGLIGFDQSSRLAVEPPSTSEVVRMVALDQRRPALPDLLGRGARRDPEDFVMGAGRRKHEAGEQELGAAGQLLDRDRVLLRHLAEDAGAGRALTAGQLGEDGMQRLVAGGEQFSRRQHRVGGQRLQEATGIRRIAHAGRLLTRCPPPATNARTRCRWG
jgi:hypothetical protein